VLAEVPIVHLRCGRPGPSLSRAAAAVAHPPPHCWVWAVGEEVGVVSGSTCIAINLFYGLSQAGRAIACA
jgi:hypothetical protein